MSTTLPLNSWTGDRSTSRRRDVAGQPILHVLSQCGVRQEFGRLRAHGRAVGMPLRSVGTVVEATPARCSIASQLARDRRCRSTKLTGNLTNAVSAGASQSDLLTL